ncbi:RidA family protein [Arthrobacter sp. ISL-28]|uniref:RidA family protein n=1 Tax=Arthrobacter sp. ISL-28 TaxID=2819108 RepID=UPI001BE64FAB|nr:Rid family detoxifying hydrolase [Arthrobacter sp. ISL-28]MBT2520161.1 RidA family protein [Arthrobacter sp. ISL-28]
MATYIAGSKNPAPAGPYSHAVQAGPFIATAGQVGVDPRTSLPVGEGVAEQTRQAIRNLAAVLEESGADLTSIFRVGVFLTDEADFEVMNAVYREMMPSPFPARTTVFAKLMPGLKVEIDALAYANVPGAGAGATTTAAATNSQAPRT